MGLGQHHRVQVVRFVTYKSPVFAEVSDIETAILCEFTGDCVETFQKLIVGKIQFLGGDGEAIVGHPVFFHEYPEIRALLYSIHIKKLVWPQSLVNEDAEQPDGTRALNESVEAFARKDKKRIHFSTPLSNDQEDLSKKKRKRFLHPGWRGFFEITYQDCMISDDQKKILEQEEGEHQLSDIILLFPYYE
ncbi:hypothetical protein MERGE_001313 [Pneumocystis wakefieldiae]|uniref:Uncharacterized protein n=1 Tax=Pneumocystis wakefieldiae TaxID=38082 RepID=A0A899G1Z0_9ASCO|nr:hypothetical protein MERGE_001313 [Pneumocystis wakefieldiae]